MFVILSVVHSAIHSVVQVIVMKMKKSKVFVSINNLIIFSVILITSSSVYCDPIKSVHLIKSDFINDINQVKGDVKNYRNEELLNDEPIDVNETDVMSWFEEPNSNLYLNHLAINSYTGQVYVGGVNWIYQLSSQLQLETKVQMGPADDSPDCPVTRNCPNVSKKPTNYFNKVLLIDYAQSRLISCGEYFISLKKIILILTCKFQKLKVKMNFFPFFRQFIPRNMFCPSTR